MERRDVIERAKELGYYRLRKAKHSDLYRHKATAKIVGVPHTPSDNRSMKNTVADLERGAVTNGRGHLGFAETAQSAHEAAVAILAKSRVPMTASEICDAATRAIGATVGATQQALINAARNNRDGIVRLKRGWYVVDPELAALPSQERRTAMDYIVKNGPRQAYRQTGIRSQALTMARQIAQEEKGALEWVEKAIEDGTARIQPQATTAPRLYELVAAESGKRGIVVLRDDEGSLWVARRLATATEDATQ